MIRNNVQKCRNENVTPLPLLSSIKIHDLTELRDMYAIINLDDENKGIDLARAHWHFVTAVMENSGCCVVCILTGVRFTPLREAP